MLDFMKQRVNAAAKPGSPDRGPRILLHLRAYSYRLVTIDSGSIVEAAHIHQFADSRNNHPRNGIALCKNAHWMFDEGLWSLDDDYRVLIDPNGSMNPVSMSYFCHPKQTHEFSFPLTPTTGPTKPILHGIANTTALSPYSVSFDLQDVEPLRIQFD